MVIKKKIIQLISAAAVIGFITGFLSSIDQLIHSVGHISANRYLYYKMFGLISLNLRGPLLIWVLHILIMNFILLTGWLLWTFLISKAIRINLNISAQVIHKKSLKTFAAFGLSVLFLIFAAWLVNSRWASAGFSLLNVLLNEGVVLLTVLLGWVLIKTEWEKLFKVIKMKYTAVVIIWMVSLLLVFTTLIFVYAKPGDRAAGPNILLVLVDCLRADRLGCYGYPKVTSPHIDKLSKQGVVFKNAFSNAPWTRPAVASLFTSLYPNQHGAINSSDALADEVLTLAEILKDRGYDTYFFNGGNPVVGDKFNFCQGFTVFESLNRATVLTDQFLAEISAAKRNRFFAYLHYMDLHLPYHPNKYNGLFTEGVKNPFLMPGYINRRVIRCAAAGDSLSDDDKRYLSALYEGQLRFVDESINKIIAYLKQRKMLDNTVVIITSDHGEEFWDHNNFEHGHSLYNELLHVPLIILGRAFKQAEIKTPVSLIDLFPTILEMAHIPVRRFKISGKSLWRLKGVHRRPIFAMGTLYDTEKYCLIKGGMKLIFNSREKKKPLIGRQSQDEFEFYNLDTDAVEQRNLESTLPKELFELKKELKRFINLSLPLKSKKISPEKEKEIREKLKSLGYL